MPSILTIPLSVLICSSFRHTTLRSRFAWHEPSHPPFLPPQSRLRHAFLRTLPVRPRIQQTPDGHPYPPRAHHHHPRVVGRQLGRRRLRRPPPPVAVHHVRLTFRPQRQTRLGPRFSNHPPISSSQAPVRATTTTKLGVATPLRSFSLGANRVERGAFPTLFSSHLPAPHVRASPGKPTRAPVASTGLSTNRAPLFIPRASRPSGYLFIERCWEITVSSSFVTSGVCGCSTFSFPSSTASAAFCALPTSRFAVFAAVVRSKR